jgi:hypothetical protein
LANLAASVAVSSPAATAAAMAAAASTLSAGFWIGGSSTAIG